MSDTEAETFLKRPRLETMTRQESFRFGDENPKASLLRPQKRRLRGLGGAAQESSEEWPDLGMAVEEEKERESEECIVD